MSPDTFQVPEIESLAELLPAFDLECLIARGNMGVVYKALQRSLDREVAIKILPRELGEDPVFRSSFEAEAKAMARLTHPNLIRVFDYGDVDGLLYMVMEYVPGKSLYHSAHGKAIDPRQAVEIAIAACNGLAHAHENGIVHRDIKPANILLTPQCEPKIGDFGLARCTRANLDGLAMGTPAYMAPEVVSQPAKGDQQSDIYAIGVVLRELLSGVFAGDPNAAKAVVPDLKLAAICRKATHPDPAMRYADAGSLAAQLTRWMNPKAAGPAAASWQPNRPRPQATALPTHRPSGGRGIFKYCAIIALLLCSVYAAWSVREAKLESIARQQQIEDNKPKVIIVSADSDRTRSFSSDSSGHLRTILVSSKR